MDILFKLLEQKIQKRYNSNISITTRTMNLLFIEGGKYIKL